MKLRMEIATPAHIRLIAPLMRERDRLEVKAGCDQESEEAMATALVESSYARTCFYGLEPLAMFGLARLTILGRSAQAWCFGTRAIDDHPLAFARASRQALSDLLSQASVLTNRVDISDEKALRWLAFLGATYVLQPQQRGGRLFAQFILSQEQRQCQRA